MFYNFIIKNDDVKNAQVNACRNIHGESKLEIILILKDYLNYNPIDPIISILLNNNRFIHFDKNAYKAQFSFSEARSLIDLDIIKVDYIKDILELYNEEIKIAEDNLLNLKKPKRKY